MQIMLYLARNKRVISSTELSGNLHISKGYVLQIARALREGNMIVTHSGMSGGYSVEKDINQICAYDIISLMEGDMSIPECVARMPGCTEACQDTNLRDALNAMNSMIVAYLKVITFAKLTDMDTSGNLSEIIALAESHSTSLTPYS
jgi:Rrf2 family protein